MHHPPSRGHRVFEDAKRKCEGMGGYLVIIDDQAERDFVVGALTALQDPALKVVWIGLYRGRSPGEWLTVRETKQSFLPWKKGNPSN